MKNLINQLFSVFIEGVKKLPPKRQLIVFILLCTIASIVMFSSCGTTTKLSINADSMHLYQPNINYKDSIFFKPK
nr:MAG TPA: YfiB membrane protein [Microviridae sp.]